MFAVSTDNSTCVNRTLQWRWLGTQKFSNASVIDLQKKKLTNYRLYTDLKLNPGNVNAWLKHNDSSKMSLDCARQIYKYAKSYPSVR